MVSTARRPAGTRWMRTTSGWSIRSMAPSRLCANARSFRRRSRCCAAADWCSAYGEMAWAERGGGALLDGQPLHVSAVKELGAAILSTGNLKTLAASSADWSRFGALVGRVNRLRGYGDFLHYHLLARGALDAVLESDINILDIAALTVIVREAGGTVTDLAGRELALETTTVLATNGALHAPILEAMRR